MERSEMTSKGIVIKELSLGWLQILSMVFVAGGVFYSVGATYKLAAEVKAKQEVTLQKYIPIVEKLDRNSTLTEQSINRLINTLERVNDNMTVVLTLRERDKEDKEKLENQVDSLVEQVTGLKIEIMSLKK